MTFYHTEEASNIKNQNKHFQKYFSNYYKLTT